MLTLEDIKKLKHGDTLLDIWGQRWRVNGKLQLWKRDPQRFRLPLKQGLYIYGQMTEYNIDLFMIEK